MLYSAAQSCLTLVALETIACQAPLSMGFPGKNTRVAFHALLQGIFPTQGLSQSLLHLPHCRWTLYTSEPPDHLRQISSNVKVAQLFPTLCDPMDYSPWYSPGQNTRVRSLSLPQGIFPIQGSPGLPHCKWILYQLSHQGSSYFSVI